MELSPNFIAIINYFASESKYTQCIDCIYHVNCDACNRVIEIINDSTCKCGNTACIPCDRANAHIYDIACDCGFYNCQSCKRASMYLDDLACIQINSHCTCKYVNASNRLAEANTIANNIINGTNINKNDFNYCLIAYTRAISLYIEAKAAKEYYDTKYDNWLIMCKIKDDAYNSWSNASDKDITREHFVVMQNNFIVAKNNATLAHNSVDTAHNDCCISYIKYAHVVCIYYSAVRAIEACMLSGLYQTL